ncbi:MAG: hypothetical protein KatS3mg077_3023 [Candidatus Binatia bacterium]|nr:MAG: hypothetical protein KatS3mg077_3023 [Candidatus Binatia bacterium]
MNFVSLSHAEELFGSDYLGPQEVERAFASSIGSPVPPPPFDAEILREAAGEGMALVYRVATLGDRPFVLERAIETFPNLFDQRFLRQVGYQLKEEWGILLEPLSRTETPRPGWALVRKETLPSSRNRTYNEQSRLLEQWGQRWQLHGLKVGRRLAVEIVYDSLLFFLSRGKRLLEREWDWSSSTTIDGGYVNVGGFGASGLQIFSYSAAVRHGALGVCPEIRSATGEN